MFSIKKHWITGFPERKSNFGFSNKYWSIFILTNRTPINSHKSQDAKYYWNFAKLNSSQIRFSFLFFNLCRTQTVNQTICFTDIDIQHDQQIKVCVASRICDMPLGKLYYLTINIEINPQLSEYICMKKRFIKVSSNYLFAIEILSSDKCFELLLWLHHNSVYIVTAATLSITHP